LNFLAHLYLAGPDDGLIIGNFIADMVKGKAYQNFPQPIQNGIIMHRQIDSFTDNHPVFRQTKQRIQKEYGLYSGVVVDIYYDHFLAHHWADFSEEKLAQFVCKKYRLLIKNFRVLPKRARYILPFMVRQNWLLNYAQLPALEKIFERMDYRTQYLSGMKTAVQTLEKNYRSIEEDFLIFMPEIISYVNNYRSED